MTLSQADGMTCHGEALNEAVIPALDNSQIIGCGVNCSSPLHVKAALQQLQVARQRGKLLVVYPNTGEEWNPVDKCVANWLMMLCKFPMKY